MRPSMCIAAACLILAGCTSSSDTAQMNSYLMGEKVQLGRLTYTVFETQWLTHLGDRTTGRVPEHRFLLLRLSVTNSGNADAAVPNPTIQDDRGKVYEELSNGEGVPQWAGYLRLAKPADTVQGNIVFDAPPGHYKLKISDEAATTFALIDLPLSYTSDTPEIVTPGQKKQAVPFR